MNIQQGIDGLKFDDHFFTYKKIEPIGILDQEVLIPHWTELLLHKLQAPEAQLVGKCALIRRLQKTRSKLTMNLDSRPDDLLRQVVCFSIHGIVLCALCVGALCSL